MMDIKCTFCGLDRTCVNRMWSGPGDPPKAYICDLCVATAYAAQRESAPSSEDVQTPPLPG